jgi:hypothetical protein
MGLSRVSLQFEFPTVPYAAAIHHIHSPEKLAEMHGLGAPFFRIDDTHPPRISPSATSISFNCSTFFMHDMHVRMFTSQPDVSHLLFFKERQALYRIKLSVVPLQVCLVCLWLYRSLIHMRAQAFTSHRMLMEILFFEHGSTRLRSLLPIFHFVEGLDSPMYPRYPRLVEDPHFKAYRRTVLRGEHSDDFWIMAERVWREYTC